MTAIVEASRRPTVGKSPEATRVYADLMALDPAIRREFLRGMSDQERRFILTAAAREGGTPFALYVDDPRGFVLDVLGENVWSKSRQILDAIPQHTRLAIPSCFSSSKTWTISRTVLWKTMVHPPSTVKVITLAPVWRQVEKIIWPEIRAAHARSELPGRVDNTQLKIASHGIEHRVAFGMPANERSESSVQGQHAPHLLLVVDEAGGVGHTIGGNLRALLTGADSRMVCIGNPASDDEGSWFEGLCSTDGVKVIPISAFDTPNMTGEKVGRCRSCPPEVPAHPLSEHLIHEFQVQETIDEHGDESPYVQAKVYARFPKGGSARAIPSSFVDAALEAEEPDAAGYVRLSSLGLEGEDRGWLVAEGAWVRLGVDVAADGGDEFVIGRQVGDLGTIEHISSGLANQKPVDVAGKVLEHIRRAEALARAIGSTYPIHVKIDAIGIGWGVAGILEAWGSEGLHSAKVYAVLVSEAPNREPQAATLNPHNKRAEMWLAGRALLTPDKESGTGRVRLRVDKRTAAQLSNPMYGTASSGKTTIEKKESLKRRGLSSPDRGEAWLLAVYEPGDKPKAAGVRLLV